MEFMDAPSNLYMPRPHLLQGRLDILELAFTNGSIKDESSCCYNDTECVSDEALCCLLIVGMSDCRQSAGCSLAQLGHIGHTVPVYCLLSLAFFGHGYT